MCACFLPLCVCVCVHVSFLCALCIELGYSQGMNDILSRFLVTLDNEHEAYWCLAKYLERIHIEFLEEGMVNKLG